MTAVGKVSFTTQAQAEFSYNHIATSSAGDYRSVRLHGKVVTIECTTFPTLIHLTNKYIQPVGGFVKKIIMQEENK